MRPRYFVWVSWMLQHALDNISTYANSCLGQNSKNFLIFVINFSPVGQAFLNTLRKSKQFLLQQPTLGRVGKKFEVNQILLYLY